MAGMIADGSLTARMAASLLGSPTTNRGRRRAATVYVVQAYTSVYDDVRYEDYVRPGAHLLAREMAQRCPAERGVLVSLGQSLLLDRAI